MRTARRTGGAQESREDLHKLRSQKSRRRHDFGICKAAQQRRGAVVIVTTVTSGNVRHLVERAPGNGVATTLEEIVKGKQRFAGVAVGRCKRDCHVRGLNQSAMSR